MFQIYCNEIYRGFFGPVGCKYEYLKKVKYKSLKMRYS